MKQVLDTFRRRVGALRLMGSRRVRRRLERAFPGEARGAVLLYHRIATTQDDPLELALSPEAFCEQLDALQQGFRVLPLGELHDAIRRRRPVKRAVAISFDDGYLDNLTIAAPALESRGLPATLYVATGFVDGPVPFWWEELHALLSGQGRAGEITAVVGGVPRRWAADNPEARRRALRAIIDLLRISAVEAIPEVVGAVREWAGHDASRPSVAPMGMDLPQLEAMAASPVVEIGAHTRRHCALPAQADAVARAEIEGSRDDLAQWLGSVPSSFSYPFGDYSPRARAIVRRAGFAFAVSVRGSGVVTRWSDPFALPRVLTAEEPGSALAERLERLLD